MGVDGQYHVPAASPPGKNRYPLYRGLGGPQGRSGQARKISPPPGFDSSVDRKLCGSRIVPVVFYEYVIWYLSDGWRLRILSDNYRLRLPTAVSPGMCAVR